MFRVSPPTGPMRRRVSRGARVFERWGLCVALAASMCQGCVEKNAEVDAPAIDAPARQPTPRADNLLLVTIDTLRADYVGVYGGPARTPNLDALASDGWLFEDCLAASMLTNPSHVSIMTSLYPRDHGVYDNESGVPDGVRTLALALSRHGLRTGAVVGFPHLNPEVSNLGRGFDQVVRAPRHVPGQPTERRADETSRTALRVLDAFAPHERFFLWVHYPDPHAPYEPPATHPPRSIEGLLSAPMQKARSASPGFQRRNAWFKRAFRAHRRTDELLQRYIAEIEATDAALGALLDGLTTRRPQQRTAIVVTSDHGENMGEHDLFFHHGGLYAPAVHVPLIVGLPGLPPQRVPEPVGSVDIAPMVLRLLGAPHWEPMRGRDWLARLRAPAPSGNTGDAAGTAAWDGPVHAFSEHMLGQAVAVRSRRGTLIEHLKDSKQFPSYPFVAGRRELYDRTQDPGEQRPLPLQGPLAEELTRALQQYLNAGLALDARKSTSSDRVSLRALGYLE